MAKRTMENRTAASAVKRRSGAARRKRSRAARTPPGLDDYIDGAGLYSALYC